MSSEAIHSVWWDYPGGACWVALLPAPFNFPFICRGFLQFAPGVGGRNVGAIPPSPKLPVITMGVRCSAIQPLQFCLKAHAALQGLPWRALPAPWDAPPHGLCRRSGSAGPTDRISSARPSSTSQVGVGDTELLAHQIVVTGELAVEISEFAQQPLPEEVLGIVCEHRTEYRAEGL